MTQDYRRTALPVRRRTHLHGSGVAGERRHSQRRQVKVETQGSIGIENELSADDVASAIS